MQKISNPHSRRNRRSWKNLPQRKLRWFNWVPVNENDIIGFGEGNGTGIENAVGNDDCFIAIVIGFAGNGFLYGTVTHLSLI